MWTFLVAQWLRLHVSNAGDAGLIPGRETKIPHAVEQLSLRTTTTEPMCPGACGPQVEKPACCNVEPTHHSEDLIQPQ